MEVDSDKTFHIRLGFPLREVRIREKPLQHLKNTYSLLFLMNYNYTIADMHPCKGIS